MKIDKRFLDKNGNIKPNSAESGDNNGSENPNTYNNVVAIMRHKLGYHDVNEFDVGQLNANKHLTNNGRYLTNDWDHEKVIKWKKESNFGTKIANTFKLSKTFNVERSPERFSHDGTNAISSGSYYFLTKPDLGEYHIHLNNISVLDYCTSQTFYRFYDVMKVVEFVKRPSDQAPLTNIRYYSARACSDEALGANNNYEASGKIQAWLRLNGLNLEMDFKICTALLPEREKWIEVFGNYFPEADHPINVMARELYGKAV